MHTFNYLLNTSTHIHKRSLKLHLPQADLIFCTQTIPLSVFTISTNGNNLFLAVQGKNFTWRPHSFLTFFSSLQPVSLYLQNETVFSLLPLLADLNTVVWLVDFLLFISTLESNIVSGVVLNHFTLFLCSKLPNQTWKTENIFYIRMKRRVAIRKRQDL